MKPLRDVIRAAGRDGDSAARALVPSELLLQALAILGEAEVVDRLLFAGRYAWVPWEQRRREGLGIVYDPAADGDPEGDRSCPGP